MVAYQKREEEMPELDESWWDSVLAEEERYVVSVSKRAKVETPVKSEETKPNPDWKEVRELYHQDRIVDLEVTGSIGVGYWWRVTACMDLFHIHI